ncbi:MAG: 16S rRNA (guanine(527)-N(7))-methyltransferase RsmG [Clostridia bacterium]|nr:16S rRNA (guanine(527)-N(7))-methyltransferase RsmG [Clostridia bacterium]
MYSMGLEENCSLNDNQTKMFEEYMNLLLEWNQRMNLTAITEKDEIILKHFVDSLTISKYIKNYSSLIDIGTGAGFPGIPLKIYDDSLNIVLLDSLNKRVNFLNEVIIKLKLENIYAIHGRAEEIARYADYREKFDVATSRAVANLSVLLEYMLPFVKMNGLCICMKGNNVKDELNDAKNALKILGGSIEKIENINLPDTDIKRTIVIIKKIRRTDIKYPRNAGIPVKKPL